MWATLSEVLNGRGAISPSMALRIERWPGRDHGGAAEVLLTQRRDSTRLAYVLDLMRRACETALIEERIITLEAKR